MISLEFSNVWHGTGEGGHCGLLYRTGGVRGTTLDCKVLHCVCSREDDTASEGIKD